MVYPHFHSPIVRGCFRPPIVKISIGFPISSIFLRSPNFPSLLIAPLRSSYCISHQSHLLPNVAVSLAKGTHHRTSAAGSLFSSTQRYILLVFYHKAFDFTISLPIPYAVIVRFESLLRLSDLRNGIQSSCYRGRFTFSPMTLHCKDYNMTLISHTRSTNTSHHTCLLTGMCVTSDLHAKQPMQPSPHIDAVSGVHSLLADMTCCQERPGLNSRCSIRFGLDSSTS